MEISNTVRDFGESPPSSAEPFAKRIVGGRRPAGPSCRRFDQGDDSSTLVLACNLLRRCRALIRDHHRRRAIFRAEPWMEGHVTLPGPVSRVLTIGDFGRKHETKTMLCYVSPPVVQTNLFFFFFFGGLCIARFGGPGANVSEPGRTTFTADPGGLWAATGRLWLHWVAALSVGWLWPAPASRFGTPRGANGSHGGPGGGANRFGFRVNWRAEFGDSPTGGSPAPGQTE